MKNTRSDSSLRLQSYNSAGSFERAEFISSKTDTRQRLGELFIYSPTKLEMFGLRSQTISNKIPTFKKKKPLFELESNDRTYDTFLNPNQNSTVSKSIQTNKEVMQLSSPKLEPEEKHEYKSPPPKELESHKPLKNRNLPPILMGATIVKPRHQYMDTVKHRKTQQMGKLIIGRLSEGVDYELMKMITAQLAPKEKDTVTCPKQAKMALKYQNLKRSKQPSLSDKIKQEKKVNKEQLKKTEIEMMAQKEKEINKIIFGKMVEDMEEFL